MRVLVVRRKDTYFQQLDRWEQVRKAELFAQPSPMVTFPLLARTVPTVSSTIISSAAEMLLTLKASAQISPVRSQVDCIQPLTNAILSGPW